MTDDSAGIGEQAVNRNYGADARKQSKNCVKVTPAATRLLIGGPATAYVVLFAVICVTAQILVQYARMCGC
jgi:hypothetical protein